MKSSQDKAPEVKYPENKDDYYLYFLKNDYHLDKVFSLLIVIDCKKTPAGYVHELPKLKLSACSDGFITNPLKNLHGIDIGSLILDVHAFILEHEEFVF